MIAVNFVVTGRVQGVGFRWYVCGVAEEMGVVGEVWNRRDGAVEGVAGFSDPDERDAFVARLHAGPGRVASVVTVPMSEVDDEGGFKIGYTR
jgi:acylphosphatase